MSRKYNLREMMKIKFNEIKVIDNRIKAIDKKIEAIYRRINAIESTDEINLSDIKRILDIKNKLLDLAIDNSN